jgi:hypothetical protein
MVPAMQSGSPLLDRERQFPTSEIAQLTSSGALSAVLPVSYGGLGMGTEARGAVHLCDLLRFIANGNLDPTNGAHALSERGVESDSLPIIGRIKGFFEHLGPGIITGASDDDPSGIATYSQVGAQFGFAMLWTMLFSYPLWRESRKSVRGLVASRGWVSLQISDA